MLYYRKKKLWMEIGGSGIGRLKGNFNLKAGDVARLRNHVKSSIKEVTSEALLNVFQ